MGLADVGLVRRTAGNLPRHGQRRDIDGDDRAGEARRRRGGQRKRWRCSGFRYGKVGRLGARDLRWQLRGAKGRQVSYA